MTTCIQLSRNFGASASPENRQLVRGFGDFIDTRTKDGQSVLIGDPHRNATLPNTLKLLAESPEAFEAASCNGAKHFLIELSVDLQDEVDTFLKTGDDTAFRQAIENYELTMTGEIYQADFWNDTLKTMQNAYNAGMRVHLIDNNADMYAEISDPYIKEYVTAIENRLGGRLKDFSTSQISNAAEEYTAEHPDVREKLLAALQREKDADILARTDDGKWLSYIRDERGIHATEPMIGVFGARHIQPGNPLNLASLLRAENHDFTTVGVFNNDHDEYGKPGYINSPDVADSPIPHEDLEYEIYFEDKRFIATGADKEPDGPIVQRPAPKSFFERLFNQ